MKKLTLSSLVFFAFYVMPSTLMACNSCMGRPDSNLGPAIRGAILGLVVLLVIICAAFLKFIFYLAKRDGLPLPEGSAE